MTQLLPPKKEVALALLERSNVDVYLDPRAKGVVVPPQFRKEPRLILKIGLNMPVPIPDLRVDEESMSCTLSFNRSPFYCVVPWTAVFAMVGEDGRGMVWPDDVPQELAVKVVEPSEGRAPGPERAAVTSASRAEPGSPRRAARGSKLAEDTSSREAGERPAARGAGGSRKKKKPEERPRPVLVAVPDAPPSNSDVERVSSRSLPSSRPSDLEARAGGRGSAPSVSAVPEAELPLERRSRPGSEAHRDGVSAIPSSRSPAPPSQRRPDGARPKRELPPYLRVVK